MRFALKCISFYQYPIIQYAVSLPIQSSPSIVTPDIAQVTNKLLKKNLSLVTSYSIFIITPFFFGPKGCDYREGRLYNGYVQLLDKYLTRYFVYPNLQFQFWVTYMQIFFWKKLITYRDNQEPDP